MISIKKSKPDSLVKIPLSFDVEVECQVLDTAQMFLARSRARVALRSDGVTTDAVSTDDFLAAFDNELLLQMAMIGVKAWTGVEEPCTPENVRALLSLSPYGQDFERMYNHVTWEATARKNGLAPWQSGSSTGAQNTVEDAVIPDSRAPEASAA